VTEKKGTPDTLFLVFSSSFLKVKQRVMAGEWKVFSKPERAIWVSVKMETRSLSLEPTLLS
jgi:hypothetical protein